MTVSARKRRASPFFEVIEESDEEEAEDGSHAELPLANYLLSHFI